MRFYDDNGNVTNEFVMAPISIHSLPSIPEGDCNETTIPMVQVEKGQWHSLEVLDEGTVVFEAKDGKYQQLSKDELLSL